jgi:hypothetical protein
VTRRKDSPPVPDPLPNVRAEAQKLSYRPAPADRATRRPGAPAGPSTTTAQAVGSYVQEVLTRLGDERDLYREALHELVSRGHLDARDLRTAQAALVKGRERTW